MPREEGARERERERDRSRRLTGLSRVIINTEEPLPCAELFVGTESDLCTYRLTLYLKYI